MITEDKDFIYVQSCETIHEALTVDYYIWKATHKECVFEYKGHTKSIRQDYDFIQNEERLQSWIDDIESSIIY